MLKNKIIKELCLFVIFVSLFNLKVGAQNSCQTAVFMNFNPPTLISSFSGEVWVKFTAVTGQDGIRVSPVLPQGARKSGVGNYIDTLQLYTGTCNALTSVKIVVRTPSTPCQVKYALIAGVDYYLRISFNNPIGYLTNTYFLLPTYPYGPSVCTSNCELVCNGDFENTSIGYPLPIPAYHTNIDYAFCYNSFWDVNVGWLDLAMDPMNGTPDYFRVQALPASATNGAYHMGVPANVNGNQASLAGANAYAGIICLEVEFPFLSNPSNPSNSGINFREYLQQEMCDSMVAGRTYQVTFSASLADNSALATHLGILFKDDTLQQINSSRYSGATPQWETPTKVTQSVGWATYTFNYTATANHKHFAIGNFRLDSSRAQLNSNYLMVTDPATSAVIQHSALAYYYIDGISIVPLDNQLTLTGPENICIGGTAVLTASIAGDTAGTQVWTSTPNDPTLANDQNKAIAVVSPTQQTTYTCSVTDIYGCGPFTASITVGIVPAPIANAGPDRSSCTFIPVTVNGSAVGTVTQTSWSVVGSTIPLCSNCTSVTYTPTSSPTFLVYTAQNGNCIDTDMMQITVQNIPIPVSITPVLGIYANVLCANVQYQVSGAPIGSTYQWQSSLPSSGTSSLFSVNWGSVPSLASGSVSVTVTAPNGCTGNNSMVVNTPCCDTSAATGAGPIFVTNANVAQLLTRVAAVCPTCVVNNNIYFTGANQPRIAVNGVLTIDQNLLIDGVDWINMGPNAAINVLAGKTLTLNNCTTETKCGIMWEGIYVTTPSSIVNITGGSLIQQAKNAIVSTTGGRFTCKNMKFDNCLKGIVVNTFTSATHQGVVNQSTFAMSGTFLPALPALPTNYTKTLAGIELDRVTSITIGDAAQPILQNSFTGLFRGIYANASGTTVRNAQFTNMVASTSLPNTFYSGTAIYCQGQNGITWAQAITVGGTAANQRCTFDNVRRGLLVILGHHVNFVGNTITNVTSGLPATGAGVTVNNCVARTLTITNNRISNQNSTIGLPHAITLTDVGGSTVTITNNRLLQSASIASSYAAQTGIGIRVQNTSAAPVVLTITSNDTIRRFALGVFVTNVSNTSLGFVNRNGIYFDKPKANYSSGLHCGINFTNSTMLKADSNRVVRLSTPNWVSTDLASLATNLRGVYVTNSTACIISENTITGMGDGIHGNDNCAGTYFVCNVLQNSYRAFMGTGTIANSVLLPHQLNYNSTNYPTGNSFSGSAVSDLAGGIRLATNTVMPINWFYSGTIPSVNGQLFTGSLTSGNLPTLSNNPSQCASFIFRVANSVEERDKLAGSQIALAEDIQVSEEEQEIAAKDAHRLLVEHPDWLHLNTPQDQDYQDFFGQIDSVDIGKSNYTEQATIAVDTTAAVSYNHAMIGNTSPAWYHKTVYEIYNRTWLVGNLELTLSDTSVLLPIALMHPAEVGEAVYTARVMLGITVDDATGSYNYRIQNPDVEETVSAIIIASPNPASSQIYVTGINEQNAVVLFTLYDLSGREVFSQTMHAEGTQLVVNVQSVASGAYLYALRVNGKVISEERLIIAR